MPGEGPAIIAPNHNSHLDTLVLFSLYPLSMVHKLRPVAAADYFLSNRFIAWFSLNVIGIIPITRGCETDRQKLFDRCHQALDQGDILILFPEGTRGQPEQLTKLRKGIFHLVRNRNDTPITPVMIQGLGQALPKGEALFVPYICRVNVGDRITVMDTSNSLLQCLEHSLHQLKNDTDSE